MNQLIPLGAQDDTPRPMTNLFEGAASLLEMLPPKVKESIDETLFTNPELFDKSESDLFKYLKQEGVQPNSTDNCLRLKFWIEYDRARMKGDKKIIIDNVVSGVCYGEYFYKKYITNPYKLAWLVSMPTGYHTRTVEALEVGINRLREILEMDPEKYGAGKAPSILALQAKVADMLNTWVKGAPVQRTLAVNVNTHQQAEKISTSLSMEELEKRMKILEKKNRNAQNLPLELGANGEVEIDA